MRNNKWTRVLAVVMTLLMMASALPALAQGEAKWTEQVMPDGWTKVTQEGGATLGYIPETGVKLIEDDGYAFKDLDKDGELDAYEDWRLTDDERASDLAAQMTLEELFGIVLYGDATITMDGEMDELLTTEIADGCRSTLTFSTNYPVATVVKFINTVQEACEETRLGVPFNLSSNPQNFGSPSNLALGATFNAELAGDVAEAQAKRYRASGISTVLGPSIELATEPRWTRVAGTFGEDPALSRDIANAIISGLQSTYDEEGNDLGWGEDSVIAVMKHFPGDGPGEGGRESHSAAGAYNVYPGNQFETSLIPFIDGGLNLDSATDESASVMLNMSIAWSDDGSLGVLMATPFSEYKIDILRERYGYDGLIMTDWLASLMAHGTAGMTQNERQYTIMMAGVDQIGPDNNPDDYKAVYDMMVESNGEEWAEDRFRQSARRIVRTYLYAGLFENPYLDVETSSAALNDEAIDELFAEANLESIVMLKNSNNAIKPSASGEKPTVYIPMLYTPTVFGYMSVTYASWDLPVDLKTAENYFNVITDTISEPTGEPDENGKPTYTANDIVRATAEELAECDMALVIVNGPASTSGFDDKTGEYIPITLQYGEYTANSEGVRSESVAGDYIETTIDTPYGPATDVSKENRSYYGKSATSDHVNDLSAILHAAENMPEEAAVVVAVNTSNAFCVNEFEAEVDAILLGFSLSDPTYFLEIAAGNYEPSALLPFQMPKDMAAVEAQLEDVPRDMECYVDANGNTYDFTFGLNWSGTIEDERVAKYDVEALTVPATPAA